MRVFQKNAAEFSENSEDSLFFFCEKHQKTLIMTIPVIIGYIRCSSERRSLQKNVSQGTKPSTKHGPIVYTDNTQCFTCFVCFSLIIKAISIFSYLSNPILSFLILSYPVLTFPFLSIFSCPIYLILSTFFFLSYPILSCVVLSDPIYFILSIFSYLS